MQKHWDLVSGNLEIKKPALLASGKILESYRLYSDLAPGYGPGRAVRALVAHWSLRVVGHCFS
jgi:hypothetical protein